MDVNTLLTQLRADREKYYKQWMETVIGYGDMGLKQVISDLDTTIKVILKYVK
jgi:hypothetical protein